jgi:hypothetical protein
MRKGRQLTREKITKTPATVGFTLDSLLRKKIDKLRRQDNDVRGLTVLRTREYRDDPGGRQPAQNAVRGSLSWGNKDGGVWSKTIADRNFAKRTLLITVVKEMVDGALSMKTSVNGPKITQPNLQLVSLVAPAQLTRIQKKNRPKNGPDFSLE